MHQHYRPPPVTASPANSPKTNPTRTNNQREGNRNEKVSETGEASDALMRSQEVPGQNKDAMAKLSQVVQNYFTKAALIILHSRTHLPAAYAKGSNVKRVNKWFNVELDETELTRDALRVWKNCDALDNRPPVMIIETFISMEDLTNNQCLAIVDERGKRWDVEEALAPSPGSLGGGKGLSRLEVVLERWQIQLGEPPKEVSKDLAAILPRIYKNSIVLFRSLFTSAKILPAGKLAKKALKSRQTQTSPKLRYRIIEGSQFTRPYKNDPLLIPLYDGIAKGRAKEDVVDHFAFDPIESAAGHFFVQVTYRSNCNFSIDESESLLSSHFMGMDEQFFAPSLGRGQGIEQLEKSYHTRSTEIGSLPQNRRENIDRPDHSQAYGSLSTFHQVGPPAGSSPLSALRAARDRASQSPTEIPSSRLPPNHRSTQGSRSSLRSSDGPPGVARRPSVSFMPFKTPSLSASPSHGEQMAANAARVSVGKASALGALAEARNPSSLGPHNAVPARGSPTVPEQVAQSSTSSSPRPSTSRYSSSFGHRKARSTGGSSRTEDENNSSGKASLTSSAAQPGSGVIAEGGGGSSGSIPTDDDNISDFLKLLDQKKDLRSFRASNDQASVEASARRTNVALNKYQRMRDSNTALSESMSSSLMLHRSSSSSSRQLSSVPPMVAGTSISTSSSPGKPISPHTPHTPAIPSRLSANSIIEYPRRRPSSEDRLEEGDRDDRTRETPSWDPGTGAIDIPTSPRPFHPSYRRSSSAAHQQPRTMPVEDDLRDILPFAMRSASLGADADDRPQLTLSELLRLQEGSAIANPSVEQDTRDYRPRQSDNDSGSSLPMTRQQSTSYEGREDVGQYPHRGGSYRPRIGRIGGRGHTPPHGSISSLDRGSGSGSSDQRGGRYSFTRPASTFEEEEPLLFAMSDFGAVHQSRRSLEEHQGGSRERGGGDSGASSRRGSKRGPGFSSENQGRQW
ncbi:MAG: hypothetical protein LQ351_005706 [Letrouitia transgressa]|nr:MAG: hypothetical protein LQ351_005706 [Letrouitia transgressa]